MMSVKLKRFCSSRKEAVYMACVELGDQTSIGELRYQAEFNFGGEVSYQLTQKYRMDWRKENDIERDARTHHDIPRRNMFNDTRMELDQVKQVAKFAKSSPKAMANLRELLEKGKFHSIDQLINAAFELEDMQLKIA